MTIDIGLMVLYSRALPHLPARLAFFATKSIMIMIIRIEGGSNYGNRRCATSTSTAPSNDRYDDCDDLSVRRARKTRSRGPKGLQLEVRLQRSPQISNIHVWVSCILHILSYTGTVVEPSTATTTAWASQWLSRKCIRLNRKTTTDCQWLSMIVNDCQGF